MQHNDHKYPKAAQERYSLHHESQVREKTQFPVSQLVYVDRSLLSTSVVAKMAVETYVEMLPRATVPYCITSTTLHTFGIKQDEFQNTISADRASMASTHKQMQDDKVNNNQLLSLSDTFVRNPGKNQAQPSHGKDNGNNIT